MKSRPTLHSSQYADRAVFENINPKSSEFFCLANQMRENADVVGDKPVRNDAGELSMSEKAKQKAWLEHYERLLNFVFEWEHEHLSNEPPLQSQLIW